MSGLSNQPLLSPWRELPPSAHNKHVSPSFHCPSAVKPLLNPLSGLFAFKMTCHVCGYTSPLSHQSFHIVTLTLPSSGACDIHQCFSLLTKPEIITGYKCDKCTLSTTIEHLQDKMASNERLILLAKSMQKPVEEVAPVEQKSKKTKEKKKRKKSLDSMVEKPLSIDQLRQRNVEIEKDIKSLKTMLRYNPGDPLVRFVYISFAYSLYFDVSSLLQSPLISHPSPPTLPNHLVSAESHVPLLCWHSMSNAPSTEHTGEH